MKYCVYCGHQADKNAKECPYCFEDISDENTEKLFHANVECIKCKSRNVEYSILKMNKRRIVYEEQLYTCKECGKQFKDKNRLGYSFNNNPQLILGSGIQKIFKYIFIFTFAFIFVHFFWNSSPEQTSYDYVQDCTGLQKVKLADIYHAYNDNKDAAIEMYTDKPFIFEGKIFRIDSDKTMLQIDSEEISPDVFVNKEEQSKLDKYKAGDTIRVCGIVKSKKTLIAVPIFVENATIIE